MRTFILHIGILFFSFSSLAQESSDYYTQLFEQGNNAYQEGNYQSAIEKYSTILQSGYESPLVYFNLGNAYYKSGQLTTSILNYEKAKKLNPSDDDINFNLDMARNQTIDKIEELPEFFVNSSWNKFILAFHIDTWSILILSFFSITLLLLFFYRSTQYSISKKLYFFLSVIFAIQFIIATIAGVGSYRYSTSTNQGIVFEATVNIKSEPNFDSTELFVIHEGTKVSILNSEDKWYKISLADGNIGWIQASAIEII